MTPGQIAELRADLDRMSLAAVRLLLWRLGPTAPMLVDASRALGLDLERLTTGHLLTALPDAAVATMADTLQRRLTELGAGATEPTEAEKEAATLALYGEPSA